MICGWLTLQKPLQVLDIFKKYRIFFITMGILSAIIITLFYFQLKPNKTLPFYNPSMVNPVLVDSTKLDVRRNHTIADFSFTNQNGKTVTQKDYDGKIYVADFFFTTCGSICPKMTANLVVVQKAIEKNDKVKLLSFTVLPEIDSVPVLKKYALEKGVDDAKWNLLTGDKHQIYDMARKSFLVAKVGNPVQQYDMVHTENFVLVDAKKRIRGFYDGTDPKSIEKLIDDINFLSIEKHK